MVQPVQMNMPPPPQPVQPGNQSQVLRMSTNELRRVVDEALAPVRNQVTLLQGRVNQLENENQRLSEVIQQMDPEAYRALDIFRRNSLLFIDFPKAAKYYCLINKSLSKNLLKKIPVISLIAGITFGLARWATAFDKYCHAKNKFEKAQAAEEAVKGVLEIASGAFGMFPGLGTTASAITDGVILAWDALDQVAINPHVDRLTYRGARDSIQVEGQINVNN